MEERVGQRRVGIGVIGENIRTCGVDGNVVSDREGGGIEYK